MDEFLRFFNQLRKKYDFCLDVGYTQTTDWSIRVGYDYLHPKFGDAIVSTQHCDIDLVFAKAQVELKEWLLKNEGGY